MYEEAVRYSMPESRLFLVPYGVDGERFAPCNRAARQAIRQELGVPESARVVLTVAALNRSHKRIDHLINEIADLDSNVWLVAAGQRTDDTQTLEREAARLLPRRFRFVTWPQSRAHLLYGAADAFALCSLTEGFGLVTIEAMLSGIPVIVHDSPVFHWVAGEIGAHYTDMGKPGALAKSLTHVFNSVSQPTARGEVLRRFSWERLVPQYVDMYRRIKQC